MSEPLITVLMTVYNGGEYLPLAIESVLRQSLQDIELLIINDCSTDGSDKVIKSYKDARITLYTNERNLGQTGSLNLGLRVAKGKYVARMDADDYAFPDWLKDQWAFGEEHPDCAVVSVKAAVIDSSNRIVRVLNSPMSFPDIVFKSFFASPINHVGCLMRKQIVVKQGGYDTTFKIAADYDLWTRLIQHGYKIIAQDKIGVAIRVHEKSVSVTERGRKDLEEMSRIMLKNILALTTFKVEGADVELLWKLVYDAGSLTEEQYLAGQELLRGIYANLKPGWEPSEPLREPMLQKLMVTIDIKRAFALIKKNDVLQIRRLAREHIQTYGVGNPLTAFYLLSFLGNIGMGCLPFLYEGAVKLWAHLKLLSKPAPALLVAK